MKLRMTQVLQAAQDAGFTAARPLNMQSLNFYQDTLRFCEQNLCGKYDNNWSCPPHSITPEEMTAQQDNFEAGVLVQTLGLLDFEDDTEGIDRIRSMHNRSFYPFVEKMRSLYGKVLAMNSGNCKLCKTCSFPDEPCRHPDEKVSSVSAYGVHVDEICEASGIDYQYHKDDNQLSYIGCVLFYRQA